MTSSRPRVEKKRDMKTRLRAGRLSIYLTEMECQRLDTGEKVSSRLGHASVSFRPTSPKPNTRSAVRTLPAAPPCFPEGSACVYSGPVGPPERVSYGHVYAKFYSVTSLVPPASTIPSRLAIFWIRPRSPVPRPPTCGFEPK